MSRLDKITLSVVGSRELADDLSAGLLAEFKDTFYLLKPTTIRQEQKELASEHASWSGNLQKGIGMEYVFLIIGSIPKRHGNLAKASQAVVNDPSKEVQRPLHRRENAPCVLSAGCTSAWHARDHRFDCVILHLIIKALRSSVRSFFLLNFSGKTLIKPKVGQNELELLIDVVDLGCFVNKFCTLIGQQICKVGWIRDQLCNGEAKGYRNISQHHRNDQYGNNPALGRF